MTNSRFTLLEVLIATAASAVLMAALLTAFSGAWRLQERAQEDAALAAPHEACVFRLTRELRAAVPSTGVMAGPFVAEAGEVGEWRHDTMEWVAAIGGTNPEAAMGDLVAVRYSLVETDVPDRYRLVRTENRNLLAAEEVDLVEVVMLDNVLSFAGSWYDGEEWQENWDSTVQGNALPLAGRVRMVVGDAQTLIEVLAPFDMQALAAVEASP